MRRWWMGVACAASLAGSNVAHAGLPVSAALAAHVEAHMPMGRSVGSPTEGRLVGGSRLDEAPYLRFLPAYASEDARWGLGSLVTMVDRSARSVHKQFPDAILSVGHLSRRGGGDIDRHASHESGRDADLSFYIRSQTNHPLYSDHMVPFRGDGTAPSWPGAFFDDARNWALVSAIVQDPHVRVTYIFVAAPLRARLLAYAAHIGASASVRNHAAELMVQPRGSLPHDDHFHVRIGCPTGMNACIELPTRPSAARLLARHGHHPATVASVKKAPPPAHAKAPDAPSHAAPPPAEPPSAEVDDTPAPSTAVLLATPFDDVDGPVEPPHGAPPLEAP